MQCYMVLHYGSCSGFRATCMNAVFARWRAARGCKGSTYANSSSSNLVITLGMGQFGERMRNSGARSLPDRSGGVASKKGSLVFLQLKKRVLLRRGPQLISGERTRIRCAARTDAFNATRRRSATRAAGKSAHSEATRRSAATPPTSQRARK